VPCRVRLANFLAPVSSEANLGGPLGWLAQYGNIIEVRIISILRGKFHPFLQDLLVLLGVGEFLPSNWIMDCLSSLFCQEGEMTQGICTSILFVLCGYDEAQLNKTLLPDILHHTPAGASTHTILHYAQEMNDRKWACSMALRLYNLAAGFHAFDWGSDKKNVEHHQSTVPPVYDLGAVTAPAALYWANNDYFAEPGVRTGRAGGISRFLHQDILQTIMGLPNVLPGMTHEVEFKSFSHLDFLWGIDADRFCKLNFRPVVLSIPRYVYKYLLNNLQYCTENDCRNL
jgi:lysosomal acid lipase/cholesteryl ester hydrolase